jgi:tRNA(fMet)-specific endonuclease VapC
MTTGYLVDSNIISELLRPVPDSKIVSSFRGAEDQISTACVVWHELIFGARRLPASKKRRRIEAFLFDVLLPSIPILPYDTQAAQWHGKERARLYAIGQPPSFADGQIASIAATNGLVVVTRNTADFKIFGDITVENWIAG